MPADRPDHFFRVEVTVNACVATPDNKVLGDNVADCTIGFSLSMSAPPRKLTDQEITDNLAHNMSPVLAAIQTTLASMGFAVLGLIDEPLFEHSSPTGELGKSTPVTVSVHLASAEAAHD